MPLRTHNRIHNRITFSNLDEVLPVPNLVAVQRDSFEWFMKKGLAEAFSSISPIEDYTGQLSLEIEYDPTDMDMKQPPKFSMEECREKDMTYAVPIFVRARFYNAETGEIKEQTIFMGDFPAMTDKGTFIINGTERVVVSQLVRSPGVLFQPGKDQKTIVTGTIHPYRGEWVEVDLESRAARDVNAGARVARKRRMSLFTLIRALGYDDEALLNRFVSHFDFLEPQWEKERDTASSREEALLEIYKRARPGEPLNIESARLYFEGAFFNSKRYDLTKVGRYKLNRKLSEEIDIMSEVLGTELEHPDPDQTVLAPAEILATASFMLHLADGKQGYRLDDQDHFANRRVRSVGELIQNQVRIGLSRIERVVRERMTTQDKETITPQSLINIRPLVTSMKEFFGTSQLSQFMDQINPVSGLAHKRRLSALGPGGLSRERAGFEVRDVHSSHYGRMCPIETPEGPNIGLIGALASYARVNEFGFIETPYRRVINGRVTDEIIYMDASEEEKYVIAQANATIDSHGNLLDERVLVRRGPKAAEIRVGTVQTTYGTTSEIDYVPPAEVDLMDVSPAQIVSVSTALIPFIEHDDANRALMGANMQKQAVPLLVPEAPYVGTGMESKVARDSGDTIFAEGDGVVEEVSGNKIVVRYDDGCVDSLGLPLGRKTYKLAKFQRSNQNTCINHKVLVNEGDRLTTGDLIADGHATDRGELALGKNLLVAFMPWEGYNYEDAIIISERLVRDDVLTSVHIQEHEVDARDTKLGAEEITRDIPNLSEEVIGNLDDRGIIRIGAEVGPGDVLVGKVTPKGETEQTAEERLLRAIFGEKAREVRDTSLKVPHGEWGKVIDVKVFSREDAHELPPGVNQIVRVYVAQRRKISEGDKLAGRHGNKGVISKILPIEDMPYLADGTSVDIILSPLGVPSRMNVGQVLESHLGYVAKHCQLADSLSTGMTGKSVKGDIDRARNSAGTDGDNSVATLKRKTRPRTNPASWVATPAFDGAHWDVKADSSGQPAIQQLLKDIVNDGANGSKLIGEDGKATLYNGRTGQPYDNPISVGYVYILKLAHLVDDKIHARSTGPYSMINQQPLGGKAQFGGQRFGEMEVWALEAYGSAHTLQEILTIKSDDVSGRVKVYEAIVKGDNIPEPGIPESFKVLIKEMQSLCLNVSVMTDAGQKVEMREIDEEAYQITEGLGIDISRPERGFDDDDERVIERNL